jgi:dihydrofolate reductase
MAASQASMRWLGFGVVPKSTTSTGHFPPGTGARRPATMGPPNACCLISMNTPPPRLCLIAALARNRCIGRANQLPWHLPEDLKHFRQVTQGHAVLMGRKTWDSLPERFRPLPGRRNLVLTRNPAWKEAGAEVVANIPSALALLQGVERVFVLGGAEVYAQAIPLADELYLTEIDAEFDGDAFFPALAPHWVPAQRETHRAAPPNEFNFSFVTYRRG